MTRIHWLFLALTLGWPAAAERTPSHYVKACDLDGTPSSVVADVYDDAAPGSLLATIPNGEVSRIGATTCYQVDLATTTAAIGYPAESDPTEKGYTVIFRDDAANERRLTEKVFGFPLPTAVSRFCERPVPIYATTPIPSRGITAVVIAAGKASYMRVEWDCTQTFGSPLVLYYITFFYDAAGKVQDARPSLTPPSP